MWWHCQYGSCNGTSLETENKQQCYHYELAVKVYVWFLSFSYHNFKVISKEERGRGLTVEQSGICQ